MKDTDWRKKICVALATGCLLAGAALAQEGRALDEKVARLMQDDEFRAAVMAYLERTHSSRERSAEEKRERDVDELERRIQALRLAMKAMMEVGRHDQAERIEHAIHAVELTLAGREDDDAMNIRETAPNLGEQADLLGLAARLWGKWGDQERQRAAAAVADEVSSRWHRQRERRKAGDGREARAPARAEVRERERERAAHIQEMRDRADQKAEAAEEGRRRDQERLRQHELEEMRRHEERELEEVRRREERQAEEARRANVELRHHLHELGARVRDMSRELQEVLAELERLQQQIR